MTTRPHLPTSTEVRRRTPAGLPSTAPAPATTDLRRHAALEAAARWRRHTDVLERCGALGAQWRPTR